MRIEIGITHEVVINGDKSWIRLAITDDYDFSDYETSTKADKAMDQAVSDLSEKVNKQLIKVIEQTVETVENYSN